MKLFNKTKEIKTVKVGAVSPHIRLGDVEHNVSVCIEEAKRAAAEGVQILAFPELTITGATCRDLFRQPPLCEAAERGLAAFVDATAELDMISFIGLPVRVDSEVYNATAVVYKGEIFAIVPKHNVYCEDGRYFDLPDFEMPQFTFAGRKTALVIDPVFPTPFDKMIRVEIGNSDYVDRRTTVVVCPFASESYVGARAGRLESARLISAKYDCTYIFAEAGIGESTTDAVYSANNIIAVRGEIVREALPFAKDNLIVAEVTVTKPSFNEKYYNEMLNRLEADEAEAPLPKNPFLSTDPEQEKEECLEALEIQAQGLAARLERSYSKTMVIGVSGGLDSTLALLVCARAADILGMDRKSIIGVTMPCFGTTKRTRSNAEKLCEALGTTLRTVDIKASVTQHLSDIGHDGVTTDVTYENAQARERTQVIMDIANMTGGLVVGTGDLSELVLGWATYNGDHMSMYSVNASVPKTMVRRIVSVYSANNSEQNEVSAILDDILATPVSPELLPPKDGEIAQCTESLVGPYELHDFFIWCTLECGLSPLETFKCAKQSLGDTYDDATILGWLRVFVRRFISQQFKRSCMPDGPMVSRISVSPRRGLSMPSDASAAVWLSELDKIEAEEK